MWSFQLSLIIVIAICYHETDAAGYFSLFGSRTIREGEDYKCAYFMDGMFNEKLTVKILNKNRELASKTIYQSSNDDDESFTGEIILKVANKNITNCRLLAYIQKSDDNGGDNKSEDDDNESAGDVEAESKSYLFQQSVDLIAVHKKHSVFIQTDRAVYKPSDTINYRLLVMDGRTKPINPKNGLLRLFDGIGNQITAVKKLKFIDGVYTGKIKLAEEPVYGNWTLRLKFADKEDEDSDKTEEFTKMIEVKEYVLPRFEVIIDTRPHISISERMMKARIYGQYTFGDFVKGKAKVTFTVFDPEYMDVAVKTVVRNIDIVTRKDIELNLAVDLDIKNLLGKNFIKITVNFEEELTGVKRDGSVNVKIHRRDDFTLELQKVQKRFKSGFPYKFRAIVRNFDGTPAPDTHPVTVTTVYKFGTIENCSKSKKKNQNTISKYEKDQEFEIKKGIAHIELDIPQNTTEISVTVEFNEIKRHLTVSRFISPSGQFLNIEVKTENVKVGDNVEIYTELTHGNVAINYVVIGRTGLVLREMVDSGEISESFEFSFAATYAMAPEATLIVYYMHPQGEVIYDYVKINIDANLPNSLSIDSSVTKSVEPGTNVTFNIKTKAKSTVYLLAVDQSIPILKTGYDIDDALVKDDMMKYGGDLTNKKYDVYGSPSRYKEFNDLDILILTNANNKEIKTSCNQVRFNAQEDDGNEDELIVEAGDDDDDDDEDDIEIADPKKPRIRTEFPETWIFEQIKFSGKKVSQKLTKTVPDTITSWVITGFSVNPELGLGIARPSKLTVFQQFFVEVHLPYSIRVGEVLSIPVIIFNYLNTDLDVNIQFYNEKNDFTFISVNKDQNGICTFNPTGNQAGSIAKKIKKKSSAGLVFTIKPLVDGLLKIKIGATSATAGDIIEKYLNVNYEGATKYNNKAFFVDLRNKRNYLENFNIPRGDSGDKAVPNSIKMDVSVIGDILGPTLENLQRLIRQPSGCGEQTMINLVPNVVVLNYLKSIGKHSTVEADALNKIRSGYQNLLKYRRANGAFGVWAGGNYQGNKFLTAYAAKTLGQARNLIAIDGNVIKGALGFLASIQQSDGAFAERDTLYHQELLNGLKSNAFALTVYTIISFLENPEYKETYKPNVDKAMSYVDRNFQEIKTNYHLAITAYAYQMYNHSRKDTVFKSLQDECEVDGEFMYWENDLKATPGTRNTGLSLKIEIASYALLAYTKAGKTFEAIKIMNWLVSQRNKNGGFYATQDTVIGLQALAEIAKVIYSPNTNMQISLTDQNNQRKDFTVNPQNAMILQQKELLPSARRVEIKAEGSGFAILQLSHQYNLRLKRPSKYFNLKITKNPTRNPNMLHLSVCASYNPEAAKASRKEEGESDENMLDSEKDETAMGKSVSDMVLIEISLPSGFEFDKDALNLLKGTKGLTKSEFKDRKTVVVLYFDNLPITDICSQVKAVRKNQVAEMKQAPVKVYEYYNYEKFAVEYYAADDSKICKT